MMLLNMNKDNTLYLSEAEWEAFNEMLERRYPPNERLVRFLNTPSALESGYIKEMLDNQDTTNISSSNGTPQV